ncbi:hypothetical protein [Bacillus xiapuensis]|uniref:Uncharacterized protein n=1 Tax=Bacillus xiapuensis TaxID=2014075 RepID=A0ABU6N820_9BACI|nr:hypothetical protein [Bacillus xiapuensis]
MEKENKQPKYSFNLMVMGQNMIFQHFVTTDINLLESYKNAIMLGNGYISWEKGAIDMRQIVGIIDNSIY